MKDHKEAIWLLLLASILMLCIVKGLGESKTGQMHRHILSAQQRIDRLAPHEDVTGDVAMYRTRAELDIAICTVSLWNYRKRLITKEEMNKAMTQLDRDMEDYPPQEAKR